MGGGNLEGQLKPNGIPVDVLKLYTAQILEALRYLHGKSVVHKDLKVVDSFIYTVFIERGVSKQCRLRFGGKSSRQCVFGARMTRIVLK